MKILVANRKHTKFKMKLQFDFLLNNYLLLII